MIFPGVVASISLALVASVLVAEARAQSSNEAKTETATAMPTEATADKSLLANEEIRFFLEDYCISCHNDAALTGGLSLESFDPSALLENTETAEKMIRKLTASMMPPAIATQPESAEVQALLRTLVTRIDEAALENPSPGRRTFQRLNRAEYTRSVGDLLAVNVDIEALLPPDTISHSFDNIADVQSMSPTLMDGYLRAASKISRAAVGERNAEPAEMTYKVPRTASQMRHVEGTPFGTRGGISVLHTFPADGEYVFRVELHGSPQGFLYGSTVDGEQVEVSINGRRVALLDIDPLISEEEDSGLNLQTTPVFVKAGPARVSTSFIRRFEGPINDLMTPVEHTLADSHIGIAYGITTLPHLRDFSVVGPYNATGVSDTPSRRAIFSCRPTAADEERPCAEEILSGVAEKAYRGTLDEWDRESLMTFYELGRDGGDFESGVRMGIEAILASPKFIFRLEETPSDAGDVYRIADLDLASRLSFFLWATTPDDELIQLARDNRLSEPDVFDEQVRRMLRDPRSESLATRFASQWLRLQDLEKLHPDALMYPWYDQTLAAAMRRETELFFEDLVRRDGSVLELLTADHTFVNERLAKHYGIPNVTGHEFRRVSYQGTNRNRSGVLGHGSILASTSIANRTSPVLRGKWVLEVLLGSPPPPPPPNVPDLEDTEAVSGDRVLTVRERLAQHRENPACNSCHSAMDPIGLVLENFDVTGAWRTKDAGMPIDTESELYDGTPIDGPLTLRDAILDRSELFLTAFTESLMTYALGRRVEHTDMPTIRQILREAEEQDYRVEAFIVSVARSPAFRMSQAADTAIATEDGF
jgi:hypothetical protein